MKQPIIILTGGVQRETGNKAQMSNIKAGIAVADIIKTTLGPKSMLKMLMDPMGGIVLTNDGNAILREIDVQHPAAKSLIELSRAQDEEVGDGTTSVIIMTGEVLRLSEQFLRKSIHPTVVVKGYYKALEDALKIADTVAVDIDLDDQETMFNVVKACLGTKFSTKWGRLIPDLAFKAVQAVHNKESSTFDCDFKKYAKVEKLPGGSLSDCEVLNGILINKDLVHPQMRKRIEKPRIILLDSNLEYKKGESMTNMEFTKEQDFADALEQERKEVKAMCDAITKLKPDIVVTEKGVSDLATHYFLKANVSVIRRLRKTDNNRLARCSGATIVNRPDELQESDVGTLCGLFEVSKIGDEYFSYFIDCGVTKACSVILRGGSKDVLNELERNLQDAMCVARNILREPKLVPGGGAFEMEVSARLLEKSKEIDSLLQYPYTAIAHSLEAIPRTLASNCGSNIVQIISDLRAEHAEGKKENVAIGLDGIKGVLANVLDLGIYDTLSVKKQSLKTAIECASMLLRIDEVVSSSKTRKQNPMAGGEKEPGEGAETFGDARDG